MIRPMNRVERFFIVKSMDPTNMNPKPITTTSLLPYSLEHTNVGRIDIEAAK